MYHRQSHYGGSSSFWEETWNDGGFDEALRFCEIDPLRCIIEQYARPGLMMLEGGCGRGHYVAFYSRQGIKVVGLDFARETLGRLRQRETALPLCAGDVAALPFSDHSFDVYYSGGVIEHFEDGATEALREAWRVLRPNGILLVSVPYFSPLRRLVSLVKTSDYRRVSHSAVDSQSAKDNRVFFQYVYQPVEFKRLLVETGFRVLSTRGYSILWGLYDLPFTDQAMRWLQRRRQSRISASANQDLRAPQHAPVKPSLLKRLVIGEDDGVPALGWLVRAMRFMCANMMMYVCVREAGRNALPSGYH